MLEKLDENCLWGSRGQAKNHTNSLSTAEHFGVGCSCLRYFISSQVPSSSHVVYLSYEDKQCQSKGQARGSHGKIKGKPETNPDPGAGPTRTGQGTHHR